LTPAFVSDRCCDSVEEHVCTWVVRHAVETRPGVDFNNRVQTEHAADGRRDVERVLMLPLVLAGDLLVERVRRLEPGLRGGDVDLKAGLRRRTHVKAVE
jgi:hypothetical protein